MSAQNVLMHLQLLFPKYFTEKEIRTVYTGLTYRTLKSASNQFSLDYYDENGNIQSEVKQSEVELRVDYTPKRKKVEIFYL